MGSRRAIIGLEEVPLAWMGEFTMFFEERGYSFIPSFYGHERNGHMGVGLAFPVDFYTLEAVSIVMPSQKVCAWPAEGCSVQTSPPSVMVMMTCLSSVALRSAFCPQVAAASKQLGKQEKAAAQAATKSFGSRAKRLASGLVNMLPFRPIYEVSRNIVPL